MDGQFVDDAVKRCRNCNTPMSERARYCSHCGQKDTTGRIKFRALLAEFLETVLNIDNKTIRTITALFIPGKLTNEFFQGRHESYFRPLRIFIIMGILHFAVIAYVVNEATEEALIEQKQEVYSNAYQISFIHQVDTIKDDLITHYGNGKNLSNAMDSLVRRLHTDVDDSIGLGYFIPSDTDLVDIKTIRFSNEDVYQLPPRQILDKYEIKGFWPRIMMRQNIRLVNNLDGVVAFAIGNLIWMLLLMMPALALILKLLYVRRDYYYVEHLIFSFHYHAFAFLITSPAYLLVEQWPIGIAFAFGIVLIYLFIAMRRVYKQGIFKTGIKFFFLNNLYLFVLIFFLTFMTIVSAVLY